MSLTLLSLLWGEAPIQFVSLEPQVISPPSPGVDGGRQAISKPSSCGRKGDDRRAVSGKRGTGWPV